MTKYLEIGQIVNTFGIKGMVKVKPFTDDINRFDKLETIFIKNKQGQKEVKIEEVKYHKQMVMLKLEGINNPDEAENLPQSWYEEFGESVSLTINKQLKLMRED